LLDDPDREVRRRVANALVNVGEKKALPALIDLLGDSSPDEAWPIADLLAAAAGARAPAVAPGSDAAGRRRCRAAWAAWWRQHGSEADLSAVRLPPRGATLLVCLDSLSAATGTVTELVPNETVYRSLDGLEYPLYAEWLPDKRILIAEYKGERISERK